MKTLKAKSKARQTSYRAPKKPPKQKDKYKTVVHECVSSEEYGTDDTFDEAKQQEITGTVRERRLAEYELTCKRLQEELEAQGPVKKDGKVVPDKKFVDMMDAVMNPNRIGLQIGDSAATVMGKRKKKDETSSSESGEEEDVQPRVAKGMPPTKLTAAQRRRRDRVPLTSDDEYEPDVIPDEKVCVLSLIHI